MAVYRVAPLGAPLDAVVEVPGSKSIANRALVCAALADGESVLTGMPDGDDTEAMLDCLGRLGLAIERAGTTVTISGGRASFRPGPLDLPTRLAGTTSRFVTALAALGPGPYTIDGEPPLRRRPMAPLHDALAALGVAVVPAEQPGHLPVTVHGPADPTVAEVSLRGDVSSQYLTALMLIAPSLPRGLRIALTTPLVSRPYVVMTAAVMASFGVEGVVVGEALITVPAGTYRPVRYAVEPDASSASYPLAAAAICGGRVRVPGLSAASVQGDAAFCQVLADMGCTVEQDVHGTTVTRSGALRGIDIDMVDMSDLVPTLAAVGVFADTPVVIRGVGFIRSKESDRLGDLCAELRAAGIDAADDADGMVVRPGHPHAARLGTHHDHRLAKIGRAHV
jgi:3-phosphoshikimate 1-carboxyvinyltransferase